MKTLLLLSLALMMHGCSVGPASEKTEPIEEAAPDEGPAVAPEPPEATRAQPQEVTEEPATEAPRNLEPPTARPATAPRPETAPLPSSTPDCSADDDCFVFFRETRCNYQQPVAIPTGQRKDARRLYPSDTADQEVACAMPDMLDELRAKKRWTASCDSGTCTLTDNGRQKGPF